MHDQETCRFLARQYVRSIADYLTISGMSPWDAPEFWAQGKIGEAYAAIEAPPNSRHWVGLEVRLGQLWKEWRVPLHEPTCIEMGAQKRIDLVLYSAASKAEDARPLALVEVKKAVLPYVAWNDVLRLARLVQLPNAPKAFFVGFMQPIPNGDLKHWRDRFLDLYPFAKDRCHFEFGRADFGAEYGAVAVRVISSEVFDAARAIGFGSPADAEDEPSASN